MFYHYTILMFIIIIIIVSITSCDSPSEDYSFAWPVSLLRNRFLQLEEEMCRPYVELCAHLVKHYQSRQ